MAGHRDHQAGAEAAAGSIQRAAAVGSSAGRYEWLDALRALAIFDVVGHHVLDHGTFYGGWAPAFLSAQHPLLGMGLPVFLLCTIALSSKRTPPRPWRQTLAAKTRRLLLPWLFWCGFYAVFNSLQILNGGGGFSDIVDYLLICLRRFYIGTDTLLWYLLFAFTAELVINAVQQRTNRFEVARPWLATAGWFGLGLVLLAMVPLLFPVPPDPSQDAWLARRTWGFAALSVPVGVGVGLLLREHGRGMSTIVSLSAAGVLCVLISLFDHDQAGVETDMVLWSARIGYGLILMAVALALPGRPPGWLRWVAGYTFAIYLIHIACDWFVSSGSYRLFGKMDPLVSAVLVWGCALVAAVLMKRTPVVKNLC